MDRKTGDSCWARTRHGLAYPAFLRSPNPPAPTAPGSKKKREHPRMSTSLLRQPLSSRNLLPSLSHPSRSSSISPTLTIQAKREHQARNRRAGDRTSTAQKTKNDQIKPPCAPIRSLSQGKKENRCRFREPAARTNPIHTPGGALISSSGTKAITSPKRSLRRQAGAAAYIKRGQASPTSSHSRV